MIVGNLEIRLLADIARLQRDMNAGRQVVSNATAGMERAANAARTALASIGAGLIGGMGLSQIMRMTDEYTKFTAQLKLGTNSQKEYAQAMEDVKRISTAAQNDIGATGVLYARIIASTRELGVTQAQVAKVTETVNLALAATGAGSAESASAMLQLSQAFGSGVLRGEEFNAVYEAAPELLRILAKSMGIPIGQLRKLAEEGKLTSDKLVLAFSDNQVINKLRENVAEIKTFSGAMTVFKNNLTEVIGEQLHASGVVATFTSAILAGAGAIRAMLDVLAIAAKIGAAYVALFVIAPPLITATAAAMTRLGHAMAVYAMNVMIGQTNTINFNKALFGTSVNARLAEGSLTKVGLAANLLFSAFIGWELGKYAESQFVQVEIAAEVMVGELAKHWERVKFSGKVAFDALTVFAREAVAKIASVLATGQELIAKGFRLIGDDRMADGIEAYAARVRDATKVEGTFAGRTAESRAEMEKNIKVIDIDTDRRSNAALVRRTLVEANERSDERAAAAAAAAVALTKEQIAEAKRQAAAYRDLTRSLQDRVDITAREAAGLAPLTVAEKAHLDLTRQITDGKLKLNSAQEAAARSLINEAGANDVLTKSNAEWAALQQQLADNARDLAQDRYALITSAQAEVEQNELLIETFGMSEDAIIRMNAARLMEQETKRLGRPLVEEEIADLKRVIELKNRSADAVGKRAEMDAGKKAADQAVEDWKRASEDINRSLTDSLMRGFEAGKGFGKNLVDTIRNMFNTLILRPVISAIVNPVAGAVTGALGFAGTAQAATGGSGVGTAVSGLGAIGSLTSGVGLLGAGGLGLQAGFGALMSGGFAGVSAAVSGGIAAIGAGTGASIAAGMGTIAGALGPIALGIGGAVMLLDKAFGRGPKEMTGVSTLTGSLDASGFAGSLQDEWKKKGGWFSSSKTGFDTRAVDSAVAEGLGQAYKAIQSTSADYARALGINADSIATRTQVIKIAMGKDEAANQKAIADFFIGVADTVAGEVLPEIAKFQAQGEAASTTLQRLAIGYSLVDTALNSIGMSFGAVGVSSLEARERLLAASGGLDAFAANTAAFQQNFLTEAERNAPVLAAVTEQLAALGLAGVDTRDEFKQVVLELDLTTEAGAKQYGALMNLQAGFAQVYPVMEATADAAAQAAAALDEANRPYLEQIRQIEVSMMSAADRRSAEIAGMDASTVALYDRLAALRLESTALEQVAARAQEVADERLSLQDQLDQLTLSSAQLLGLQRAALDESNRALFDQIQAIKGQAAAAEASKAAIEASKAAAAGLLGGVDSAFSVLQSVVNRQKAALQEEISIRTKSVQSIQSLSQSLRSTLDGMTVQGREAEGRQSAQAQIQAALAIAKASGGLPNAEDLRSALSAASNVSPEMFATQQDYLRDFYATRAGIEDLGVLADDALSVEEWSLKKLEDQVKQYDQMLERQQQQIDVLKGISTTGLSIEQAMKGLAAAMEAAKANPVVSAGAAITGAYQQHLGRAPDAAGLEWWKDAAAGGAPISQIVDGIANSAEANLNKLYESVLGRAPDAAGLAFWMNAYGPTMDAAEQADFLKASTPEIEAIKAGKQDEFLKVRGFASGGDHAGGWRIVGENGPELEATGSARIFNAGQTSNFMRELASPSGGSQALVAELRSLRKQVERLEIAAGRTATATEGTATNTGQLADQFENVTDGGNAMRVEVLA